MQITEIIYSLILTAGLSFAIWKLHWFNLSNIRKTWIVGAFLLKILAGIAMWGVYSYYYTDRNEADIFKYFDDSKVMYDALENNPDDYFSMLFGINNDNSYYDSVYYSKMNHWYRTYETVTYNDSHTIIRVNAFFRIFSFGYYQVHSILMAFLSFIGLIAIFKVFESYMKNSRKYLFAILFLLPSVVFWGSGAVKEGLLLFAMGIFLFSIHKLTFFAISAQFIIILVLSVFLLFYIKFYVLASFIPLIMAKLWSTLSNYKAIFFKYAIMVLLFINFLVFIPYISPNWNIFEILAQKQRDFIGLATSEHSGSFIHPIAFDANFLSVLVHSPQAFLNVAFRPLITDLSSVLMLPSLGENIAIVVLIILAFVFPRKKDFIAFNMIWFCAFFVIFQFVLIGLTTPVIGAMVRYRLPGLIFLFILFGLIIDFDKIKKKLRISKI